MASDSPNFDQIVDATVGIETPHYEVHKGVMWFASCMADHGSEIADDANYDCLIIIAGNRSVHIVIGAAAGGDAEMYLFENTIASNNGIRLGTPNMNRDSGGTPGTWVYETPTITDVGQNLMQTFMPGGEKKDSLGSVVRAGTEWVLRRGIVYLVRITNRSGAAQQISIALEWYEEEAIIA